MSIVPTDARLCYEGDVLLCKINMKLKKLRTDVIFGLYTNYTYVINQRLEVLQLKLCSLIDKLCSLLQHRMMLVLLRTYERGVLNRLHIPMSYTSLPHAGTRITLDKQFVARQHFTVQHGNLVTRNTHATWSHATHAQLGHTRLP